MPSIPITSRGAAALYSRQRGRGGERMSKAQASQRRGLSP
jgi:hypothetical protein